MNYKSQTLSAVVITCNHAETLERVLSSLHWVDELIVYDRGSTDGTLAIARMFTNRVYFHPSDNPVIVRRDAFSSATCDWLLAIEPEEWVEEMLKHEIDGVLLNADTSVNGYRIARKLQFQGQWVEAGLGAPESELRLVRKGRWTIAENWQAELTVEGGVSKLDRPLGHAPYHTLETLFEDVNRRSTLAAYDYLEHHGHPGMAASLPHLIWQFKWASFRHCLIYGGLTGGFTGLVMTMAKACEAFLKFAKIRMLTTRRV